MRVFISVDIEGCVGVLDREHTTRTGKDYGAARLRMTREAAAAVHGCVDAGADEVVVADGHGDKVNLVLEEMPREARVVYGTTRLLGMMEGIDARCAAAMYVGYHTAAGVPGQLSHTITSAAFYAVRRNGEICSEFDLNSALAAELGVPSVMVAGDDQLAAYIRKHYPEVRTVTVKEYRGRSASRAAHPGRACEEIRQALLHREEAPLAVVKRPEMEVDLMNEVQADYAALIPGVKRIGPRTVGFRSETAREAYQRLLLIVRVTRM